MAISVHIAHVAIRKVNSIDGTVLTKDDPAETIKQHIQFDHQHRIIEDSAVPNTTGQPTVDSYIAAEAAIDYVVHYMDQYTVITYLRNSTGGFP